MSKTLREALEEFMPNFTNAKKGDKAFLYGFGEIEIAENSSIHYEPIGVKNRTTNWMNHLILRFFYSGKGAYYGKHPVLFHTAEQAKSYYDIVMKYPDTEMWQDITPLRLSDKTSKSIEELAEKLSKATVKDIYSYNIIKLTKEK